MEAIHASRGPGFEGGMYVRYTPGYARILSPILSLGIAYRRFSFDKTFAVYEYFYGAPAYLYRQGVATRGYWLCDPSLTFAICPVRTWRLSLLVGGGVELPFESRERFTYTESGASYDRFGNLVRAYQDVPGVEESLEVKDPGILFYASAGVRFLLRVKKAPVPISLLYREAAFPNKSEVSWSSVDQVRSLSFSVGIPLRTGNNKRKKD